jgi:transposase-like protein
VSEKKRKVHSPEFKAKVGLEALKGVKTINEIGQEHGVHPPLCQDSCRALC